MSKGSHLLHELSLNHQRLLNPMKKPSIFAFSSLLFSKKFLLLQNSCENIFIIQIQSHKIRLIFCAG
ncbi:MAG: hypothetical protein A2161_11260 [Candidatus Schekmanbacteria bacterium RBG_13_48_7]|uniref:Uncharacterized protein n=1 Tax=Candidatus Schekmanbacteria bacterium RBG_13_48_7 TaxID=1817878 RepID=A0A1F7RTU1_9BACT|nr:MAG: hypothetical protein A2161_11260 [Candidatus Schekmanbacteria bacterium RBG_13_48_7]